MARILQEEAPLIERLKPDTEPAFLLLVERSPRRCWPSSKSFGPSSTRT
jgi:hypothetical protein